MGEAGGPSLDNVVQKYVEVQAWYTRLKVSGNDIIQFSFTLGQSRKKPNEKRREWNLSVEKEKSVHECII